LTVEMMVVITTDWLLQTCTNRKDFHISEVLHVVLGDVIVVL